MGGYWRTAFAFINATCCPSRSRHRLVAQAHGARRVQDCNNVTCPRPMRYTDSRGRPGSVSGQVSALVEHSWPEGVPEFHAVRPPTSVQLQALRGRIIKRLMRLLTREGYLIEEQGMTYLVCNVRFNGGNRNTSRLGADHAALIQWRYARVISRRLTDEPFERRRCDQTFDSAQAQH